MFWKGEHGYSNVAENEVLGEEIQEFEKMFRSLPGIPRQIVVSVVRLKDTAE